jgi:hypothetical protein
MRPEDFPTGHEFLSTKPDPTVTMVGGVKHTTWPPDPCETCSQPYSAHVKRQPIPAQVRTIVDQLMDAAGAGVDLRQSLNDHLDQFVARQMYQWFETFVREVKLYNGWLVIETGECNCAGGGPEASGMHESHCGMEPVAQVNTWRHDALVIRRAAEKLPEISAGPEREALLGLANRVESGTEADW